MVDIAKLTVQFEAETAKFRQQLEQNNRSLEKFRNDVNKKLGVIRQAFVIGLGTGLGAELNRALNSAVSALPRLFSKITDDADQLQKLNLRLGASVEALSELKYVAELGGVSFNTLTTGFQRMTRRIAEAANGTGEAKNALAELGLSATALAQLKPEDQFEAIAEAMLGISKDSDKVRLAMKLFDSEGVALIQTMEGGAAAIQSTREEARRLGRTISQEQADSAAKFNDAWNRIKSTFEGAAQTIAFELVDTLNELAATLEEKVGPAIRKVLEYFDLVKPRAVAMREVERELEAVKRGIKATQEALDFNKGQGNQTAVEALTNSLKDQEKQLEILQEKLNRYNGVVKSGGSSSPRSVPNLFIPPVPPGTKDKPRSRATRSVDRYAEDLQALIDRLDPASREARDLEQAITLLNKAFFDNGDIGPERYSELIQKLTTDTEALKEAEQKLASDREKANRFIKDIDPASAIRDQIFEIQRLREVFQDIAPEIADSLAEAEFEAQIELGKIVDVSEEAAEKAKDAWQGFGDIIGSAFEDALVSGGNLRDVIRGLGDDIYRLVTRNLVTKPLAGFVEGIFSGENGLLANFFGGARASGGPVSAGRAYIVGENGPELYMPGNNGHIVPANETRRMLGGRQIGDVTVNISTPDADSFRKNRRQMARDLRTDLLGAF